MFKYLFNSKAQLNELAFGSDYLYELTDQERSELKKCLLEMYVDLNDICEKYGLNLILVGGSALGAIRHKGFIPWDDDLDLAMERKDYNKLLEIFEFELGNKYILNAPNYKTVPKTRFAKVFKKGTTMREIGDDGGQFPDNIFIDIFPIESVPDNKILQKVIGILINGLMFISSKVSLYKNRSHMLKKFLTSSKKGKYSYYVQCMIGFTFSFLSQKVWVNIVDKILSSSKGKQFCNIPTGRKHYFGELMRREDYFPPIIGEFEGLKVKLPNKIDKVLRNLYGEYMQIPPLNKREKHFIVEFNIGK